jgi:hypothetical protein
MGAVRAGSGPARALAPTAGRVAGRLPLTLCLLAAITGMRVLGNLAPGVAARLAWATSTTIPRMLTHPARVFVGSVPWLIHAPLPPWLLLVVISVGGLEATVGTVLALAVVLAGHVGATVISEGVLGVRVAVFGLPHGDLDVLDVGPSYVVATGLTATAVLTRRRWLRIVAAGTVALVIPSFCAGLTHGDLDGVGHTCALTLGALTATSPTLRRRAAGNNLLEVMVIN